MLTAMHPNYSFPLFLGPLRTGFRRTVGDSRIVMLRGARCPAENLCCMVQASGEGALLVCFLDHGFPQVKSSASPTFWVCCLVLLGAGSVDELCLARFYHLISSFAAIVHFNFGIVTGFTISDETTFNHQSINFPLDLGG